MEIVTAPGADVLRVRPGVINLYIGSARQDVGGNVADVYRQSRRSDAISRSTRLDHRSAARQRERPYRQSGHRLAGDRLPLGHVETQGDTLGGFVDVVFVGVGENESRTNFDLNVDNDTTAMDLALVWSPGEERMTGIELYGGLRYVSNDFSLVADPIPPILPTVTTGSDSSYYDLLFGARYIMPLSEQWRLTFSGDISVGDTKGTFSVGAHAGYRMGQHHFIGGYKHFEMDPESGGGGDLTVTMTGPVIAYGYSF